MRNEKETPNFVETKTCIATNGERAKNELIEEAGCQVVRREGRRQGRKDEHCLWMRAFISAARPKSKAFLPDVPLFSSFLFSDAGGSGWEWKERGRVQ